MVEAFVERRFELGEAAKVVVRFGRPVPEGEDYRCEYKIAWPSRTLASFALGVDEVQALICRWRKLISSGWFRTRPGTANFAGLTRSS
jgi:hypothetical protein